MKLNTQLEFSNQQSTMLTKSPSLIKNFARRICTNKIEEFFFFLLKLNSFKITIRNNLLFPPGTGAGAICADCEQSARTLAKNSFQTSSTMAVQKLYEQTEQTAHHPFLLCHFFSRKCDDNTQAWVLHERERETMATPMDIISRIIQTLALINLRVCLCKCLCIVQTRGCWQKSFGWQTIVLLFRPSSRAV